MERGARPKIRKRWPVNVEADASTDDGAYKIVFDATEFFEKADAKDIVKLAVEGWGSNYSADYVAEFIAYEASPSNQDLVEMFDYDQTNQVGFEVHVERATAMRWLSENRPDVADAIRRLRL